MERTALHSDPQVIPFPLPERPAFPLPADADDECTTGWRPAVVWAAWWIGSWLVVGLAVAGVWSAVRALLGG